MDSDEALKHYNHLFATDNFNWTDTNIEELPESTRKYIKHILDSGHTVKLHLPVEGDLYLFLVNSEAVPYFIHHANYSSHMYGDKDFNNIHPNQAISALCCEQYGIPTDSLTKIFDKIDESLDPIYKGEIEVDDEPVWGVILPPLAFEQAVDHLAHVGMVATKEDISNIKPGPITVTGAMEMETSRLIKETLDIGIAMIGQGPKVDLLWDAMGADKQKYRFMILKRVEMEKDNGSDHSNN